MLGAAIGIFCSMLFCAILFSAIGLYAGTRKEPMWFWSGSHVAKSTISDIKEYNKANKYLWLIYSIPYWVGSICAFINMKISIICLVFSCTLGFVLLILSYNKIYNKYKI